MMRRVEIAKVSRGESFRFLGFDFRRILRRRGEWRTYRTPELRDEQRCSEALGRVPSPPIATSPSSCSVDQPDTARVGELLCDWTRRASIQFSLRTGLERKSGAICCEPENARVSAGHGGVGKGCIRSWVCSTTAGFGGPNHGLFQRGRSRKLWGETYRQSVEREIRTLRFRRGGAWKRGMAEDSV